MYEVCMVEVKTHFLPQALTLNFVLQKKSRSILSVYLTYHVLYEVLEIQNSTAITVVELDASATFFEC